MDNIKVHLFFRKPRKFENHSIEKLFGSFKKKKDKQIRFKILICPFISSGFLKRFFNCIWAYLNQGDVNHITGDINFLSIFLNKNKTINTFHDCYNLRQFSGLKKIIYKYFWFTLPFNSSKIITTVSDFSKSELKTLTKTKKKIHVVPTFLPDINYKIKKNKKNTILIIGTTKNKNLDRILHAIKSLKTKIIILGKINKYQNNFLKKNKIEYKNYINVSDQQLLNIYNQGKVMLFPSLYEGFGLPIIEAQRMKVPVITSNLSPMKEITKKTAILVDPKNIKDIEKKLKNLMSNKSLRHKMIKKGYKNSFKFNSNRSINKYFQLYKKIFMENSL